jgi:hypothetical protein
VGGKRPSGAGCLFPSQCVGNLCSGDAKGCGTCQDGSFAPGKTCGRFQCRPGDTCDETVDKCVSRSTFVYAAEGESCHNSKTSTVICQGDLQCLHVNGTVAMTCQNLRRFDCGTRQCDSGSYCREFSTGTCAPVAKLGETCDGAKTNGLPPGQTARQLATSIGSLPRTPTGAFRATGSELSQSRARRCRRVRAPLSRNDLALSDDTETLRMTFTK